MRLSTSLRAALRASLVAALVAACSSSGPVSGGEDERRPVDAQPGADAEAPLLEAGADAADAGEDAPAVDDDLLGTLEGSCGVVKTLIGSPAPAHEENALVFVAGEIYDRDALSPGGQAIYDEPNAGGSSVESEVMSFEVLRYCEGAKLLKTETQIGYGPPGPPGTNAITDILVEIDGKKVGVSVTRAYRPPSLPLTDADVKKLLEDKLTDVNHSSARVLPADRWAKQILHVFAVDEAAADAVARMWPTVDAAIRADTVVLVTRTRGGGFVYCNPDPPLGAECQ